MREKDQIPLDTDDATGTVCKNCATPLAAHDNYCTNCGAEVVRQRLTVSNLLQKLWAALTDLDSAFIQTFKKLTIVPGEVSNAYTSGVRKQFANPWKYMLISLTVLGLYLYVNPFPAIEAFGTQEGFKAGYEIGGGDLSDEEEVEKQLEQVEEINKGMEQMLTNPNYYNFSFFLLIPVYALLSFLIFRHFHYNYAEHLVLNAYVSAHYNYYVLLWGVLCWLLSLKGEWFYAGTTFLYYVYLPQVFVTTFKVSIGKAIVKSLLHLLLMIVAFIAVFIISALVAIAVTVMF